MKGGACARLAGGARNSRWRFGAIAAERVVPMRLPSVSRQDMKRLWRALVDDHVEQGAAALAFYLVLAVFPGAIFGISVLPRVPIPHLQLAVTDLLGDALPGSAADMLKDSIRSVGSGGHPGLLALELLFATWAAASGLAGAMYQLNVVYDVKEDRSFWRVRAIALLLALSFCALLLGALSLAVFGGMLQSYVGERLGWSAGLLFFFATLRWVIIVTALELAFSLVYYLGPNTRRAFAFVTPGSVVATVGVVLSSGALKLYVRHSAGLDVLLGGLGSVIVILLWLFLASLVTLLGAEINATFPRAPPRDG